MKTLIIAIAIASGLFMETACTSNSNTQKALPIYGNREPVTKTVNGKTITDTVYQTIPAFQFVNQYGKTITNKSLDGNIYVADFFFTSCPSICPVMHRNMLNVYNAFKDGNNVKILSYSIDPKHDSVDVLKKYADKLGISGNTWWFLQGNKEETYKLANNYLVAVKEDSNTPGGYIHSGYFVLIDKQKRIRGTYDGTNTDDVNKLINDIKTLQSEPAETIAQ
ncbi:SCO family protein [Mucilaginibacter robiniae]|uniref:SCO family protein n=1 Tax=Mucilaginibacter robiniae TaxID=2728022 RepID=A0A7L5E3E4_9SPHI|nr:SCO family protein [Mucilaginibacter robiniae]QJD97862.1 SCO family protein [Mucilaginibacter robiniae]